MSLYDYRASQKIASDDYPFYAIVMAAMRQADTDNAEALRRAFPRVWDELQKRYNAPAGCLSEEEFKILEREQSHD